MQLRLPWFQSAPSPGSADPAGRQTPPRTPRAPTPYVAAINGAAVPVAIARHPRARRYVLRMGPDGQLRLTVPRGASIRGGLAFVARQAGWIDKERARRAAQVSDWTDETTLWWRGVRVTPARGGLAVAIGNDVMPTVGAGTPLRRAFEPWARALAARELTARCQELAAACGEAITRVQVRNQRSRWGSCSPRRVIALNWRLIQTPPSVSDYVIVHELMHLRQANHSRRFWREVESVCPGWREAERWLRRYGREVL
jgi:predicted metal-dependent hydrolase